MVVWEVKLIKRVEQYISNMFYVGFRISCLNQDFQDFRIFRIRESYTPVAPLGLFVDGYPLTIHLSPLRGYSVHVTGLLRARGPRPYDRHEVTNVRGAMNCATTNAFSP